MLLTAVGVCTKKRSTTPPLRWRPFRGNVFGGFPRKVANENRVASENRRVSSCSNERSLGSEALQVKNRSSSSWGLAYSHDKECPSERRLGLASCR